MLSTFRPPLSKSASSSEGLAGLTVHADLREVRILDGQQVLARHRRCWDKGQLMKAVAQGAGNQVRKGRCCAILYCTNLLPKTNANFSHRRKLRRQVHNWQKARQTYGCEFLRPGYRNRGILR